MALGSNLAGIYRLVTRGETAALYDFVGDDVIPFANERFKDPGKPLWLNLGYWEGASTYPEACATLARRMGDAAALQSSDDVLDVGFGFGEQHYVWLDAFDVGRIVGINIAPIQLDVAKRRARELKREGRLDLRLGSATELPFEDATFDKVMALECAFHFRTRETFLREARRVLRPGGRLTFIDMMPMPGQPTGGVRRRLVRLLSAFPEENMYDRDRCVTLLGELGYRDVTCASIRDRVYPGFAQYMRRRRRGEPMAQIVVDLDEGDRAAVDYHARWWSDNLAISDYLIFTADKPA